MFKLSLMRERIGRRSRWLCIAVGLMFIVALGLRAAEAHPEHIAALSQPAIGDVMDNGASHHPCEPGSSAGHIECTSAVGFNLGPTDGAVTPLPRVSQVVEPGADFMHRGRDIAPLFHPPKRFRHA